MKGRIQRLLPKNKFVRHVSVLVGGTAAGRVIVIAASPLLTRLYTPDDFGLLGVFASLLAIGGVIASLRYQLAIPLPESNKEAASISILSLLVVLFLTSLTVIGLVLWGAQLSLLINTPELKPYFWLLPLGLFLLGSYQVLNYWAIRQKAFTAIARTKLSQSVGMVAVQLVGYMFGPLALLLSQIAGQAAGSSGLAIRTVRPSWVVFRGVRLPDVVYAARRWRRFPLYSSLGGLLNAAGARLPTILIAAHFSPAIAGLYALTERVMSLPMNLVGQSIANVFFAESSDLYRTQKLKPFVTKIYCALSLVGMPIMLAVVIVGPDAFRFVFGHQWVQAGEIARWLAPAMYLQFITSPFTRLYNVYEKQVQNTICQVVLVILRISGLLVGFYFNDLFVAIFLFALGSIVGYLCLLIYIMLKCGMEIWNLIAIQLNCVVMAFLVCIPIAIFALFLHSVLWLLVTILVAAINYSLCVFIQFRKTRIWG